MFEESSKSVVSLAEKQQQIQAEDAGPWRTRTTGIEQDRPQTGRKENILRKIQNFRVEFGPSRKDILNFTNQLAVMVRAGISIPEVLESIAQQNDNEKFKAVIIDLKNQIEAGQSFSQALAEHPQVFSNLYINMVAAAEVSGSLSEMLQKLAEYLDRESETGAQVKSACVYPIIIAVMAVLVTNFLLVFVLPRFTAVFAGKEHLLPIPTKILMATSMFLRAYWLFIIPAVGGALCGFWRFIGTSVGRLWWDKMKLVLPLIKTLCRCLYITRSLHTMGVLTRAGVPILNIISITAHISGNIFYKNMWLEVYEDVRQGKKIADSLQRTAKRKNRRYDLMPTNVVQMIRSGEDSGMMSDVLRDISEYYARELRTVIKTVTSMIEPIMIVLMGLVVGFIAMSIILPIFKMSSVVMGR
ncbi:MAG TPA: type II secretion system F family protein [Sedimentisphaerales bacterium]|nr:type II secretion system F family protein [Sedimentisphaerales bacterium]